MLRIFGPGQSDVRVFAGLEAAAEAWLTFPCDSSA